MKDEEIQKIGGERRPGREREGGIGEIEKKRKKLEGPIF